ncbi:hypothetical protein ACP70R_028259 [Stipagrostis hirtigluma subsp. patula]
MHMEPSTNWRCIKCFCGAQIIEFRSQGGRIFFKCKRNICGDPTSCPFIRSKLQYKELLDAGYDVVPAPTAPRWAQPAPPPTAFEEGIIRSLNMNAANTGATSAGNHSTATHHHSSAMEFGSAASPIRACNFAASGQHQQVHHRSAAGSPSVPATGNQPAATHEFALKLDIMTFHDEYGYLLDKVRKDELLATQKQVDEVNKRVTDVEGKVTDVEGKANKLSGKVSELSSSVYSYSKTTNTNVKTLLGIQKASMGFQAVVVVVVLILAAAILTK